MPRLKDTDWEKIYNNISIISFMQGLSIGGKIYSGYSVIPNNNNKEVVTEDSIVFVCDDKVYNTTSKYFVNGTTNPVLDNNISSRLTAVSKNTVSRASSENLETGEVRYFYRYPKDNGWYDYDSIVTSLNNNSDYSMQKSSTKTINYNNLYDYMEGFKDELTNKKLIATNYFTALGRERQGMYRVHNNGVFKTLYEGDNE